MRHYKKGRKLGTDASHTKAIKKSLVVALFTNDRIKTTLERAKEIRGDVDRVITWAKRGDVHSRRLAIAALGDKNLVAEIFAKVEQGLFKDRQGGYSRIMRLGTRRGDAASIVIMELVQEPVVKKGAAAEPAKKSVISRVARKGKSDKPVDEVVEVAEATTEEVAAAKESVEEAVVEEAAEESVEEVAAEEVAVDEVIVDDAAPADSQGAEEAEDTDK